MKNKYYVEGKLVRTSENDYQYAVMIGNKVISCCSRYDLAEKRFNQEKNHFQNYVISGNEKSLSKYEVDSFDYMRLKEIIEKQKKLLTTIRIVKLEKVSA